MKTRDDKAPKKSAANQSAVKKSAAKPAKKSAAKKPAAKRTKKASAHSAAGAVEAPRLLVPMVVEALVIGANRGTIPFSNVTPNFRLTTELTLGTYIEPPPFSPATNMPVGVHLRWALPDALTHGVQGQAVAVAELDGRGGVGTITVLNGGFGYLAAAPPRVLLVGGGGLGAEARAVVDGTGVVTQVVIVSPGADYDAAPAVQIGSSDEIRYPSIPNRWFIIRSYADDSDADDSDADDSDADDSDADDDAQKVTLESWVVVSDTLSDNEYGRLSVGSLPLSYQSQLKPGTISPSLRDALVALGLPVRPTARLQTPLYLTTKNVWYVDNDGLAFYSIEVRTSDLFVGANSVISWPQISEPDPYLVFPPFKFLGRAWPYPAWDGANPPVAEKRLTAIGPGDPTFAASYPNSRSVLGFYDDLADLPLGGNVTYTVAGWYADPAQNPLAGADTPAKWEARMLELLWCLAQDPGGYPAGSICSDGAPAAQVAAVLPTDILCQGMVYGVAWKGPNADYPSGVPDGRPDLALGNTSVEAISALIAKKLENDGIITPAEGVGVEELLEAFTYDVMDLLVQPDGIIRLEQMLHEKTLGQRPGPVIWGVMEKQDEAAEIREDASLGTPFPTEVSDALTRVNTLQTQSDQKSAELQSLRWELYSAWFRKVLKDNAPSGVTALRADELDERIRALFTTFEPHLPERMAEAVALLRTPPAEGAVADADAAAAGITIKQIVEVINRLIAEIQKQEPVLAQLLADLAAAETTLLSAVTRLMPGYEVTKSAGMSYWQANDPVVLFAGDGISRSFAHGADAALAEGESTPCRVSGQTITALTTPVPDHAAQTITQTQLQTYYGSFPSGVPIPADVQPLFIETLLLDTTMDRLMALSAWQLAGVPTPTPDQIGAVAASIEAIQTAPLNAFLHPSMRARVPELDAQALAEAAGLTGVYPFKLAVDPWSQPWNPLYLEWQVFWDASYNVPSELKFCDTPSPACAEKWMLEEVDYAWNTKFDPTVPDDARYLYSGRTVMTPNAPDELAARLLKYLQEHPESPYYATLLAIYDIVKNLEVLSQTMSGFANILTQRRETLQLPVIDYVTPSLGAKVSASTLTQNLYSPMPGHGYTPLRGGHARIVRLWIAGSFGQTQKIVDSGSTFLPVLSKPLITPGKPELFQLTPRVVQPSRLELRWIDASNDGRLSTSDPATSPICGWIMPNYFDNSVMVYDGVGQPVGALQLLEGAFGSGSGVRWLEPPGSQSAVGATPSLDSPQLNPHLSGFVHGLLDYGADGRKALSDLIVTINATLSTIVVTGSAAIYGNLPVLVGRPMALVRAAFRIGMQGLPAYDQSWAALETYYKTSKFVTGGFTDVLFPVRLGDVRQSRDGTIGYFRGNEYTKFNSKLIGQTPRSEYVQYEQRLHLTADPDAKPEYVTVVVDPRVPIHVISDFMPQIETLLQPAGLSAALSAMDVTFRVGPLVTDETALSMPMPADIHGSWTWLYHPNVTMWNEAANIQDDDAIARFPPLPRHISEGWLKLSDALSLETTKAAAKKPATPTRFARRPQPRRR
jgi:hypothetical protein